MGRKTASHTLKTVISLPNLKGVKYIEVDDIVFYDIILSTKAISRKND